MLFPTNFKFEEPQKLTLQTVIRLAIRMFSIAKYKVNGFGKPRLPFSDSRRKLTLRVGIVWVRYEVSLVFLNTFR